MQFRLQINNMAQITTEIGDGIIKMSYMTSDELARYLIAELFDRTWRKQAMELTTEQINEVRNLNEQLTTTD